MGNPSWGKGYHTGYADGAKSGGLIGAGVAFAITGITVAAHWGYKKIKLSQTQKREQELLTEDALLISEENDDDGRAENLTE